MQFYFKTVFINIMLLIFSACNSTSGTASNTSPSQLTTFSGYVVDGYISGATICLDTNNNALCDSNEQSVTSDENGEFTFSDVALEENAFIDILAFGGTDISTEEDFEGRINRIIDTSTLDPTKNITISPLTDLVAASFLNATTHDSRTLEDAKNTIADMLNIEHSYIDNDPMKDINLFAKAQELQQIKSLIQIVTKKNIDTALTLSDKVKLLHSIKKELLYYDLDISKVLIAMEIEYDMTIAANEKIFVVNQLQEFQDTLQSLSEDTSLDIENLNRLQESITKTFQEIDQTLLNIQEEDTPTIINIDITAESITQSIFDTTDAISDEQACQSDNGYNIIENYNFSPERTSDLNNGISIKSDIELETNTNNATFKLFYPNLTQTLTDEKIIVFQDNYYFVFDKAWIDNEDKSVYVMTPKNAQNQYECYKFVLNFTIADNITGTKVFKYSDI